MKLTGGDYQVLKFLEDRQADEFLNVKFIYPRVRRPDGRLFSTIKVVSSLCSSLSSRGLLEREKRGYVYGYGYGYRITAKGMYALGKTPFIDNKQHEEVPYYL